MAKKRRLIWTQRAKADLRDIKGFIAQHAPHTAESVVRRIRERARQLVAQVHAAPVVEEVGNPSFRETYFGYYRIMYHITDDAVVISSVFHGAQRFTDDLLTDDASTNGT
jgi:plasmid stabilization system protein ParE